MEAIRKYLSQHLMKIKIQIEKIVSNYLYKDVLKFQSLKNAEIVRKLLEALALQIE